MKSQRSATSPAKQVQFSEEVATPPRGRAMDVESQIACVMNLQSITEKLLFSMNLPKDISEKYNFLKQQTF